MRELEQILQLIEREKSSIHTFIEHMGIITGNIEDNLTKELLAHLIEEEEEHLGRLDELIPTLHTYLAANSGNVSADTVDHAQPLTQSFSAPVASMPSIASDRRHQLTVGSLIR